MASSLNIGIDSKAGMSPSVRLVGRYDGNDIGFYYVRDDVAEEYTLEEVEDIRENLFFEGMQTEHLETLFNNRELRAQMFAFADIIVFHFNIDAESGLYVEVDAGKFDDLFAFITDYKGVSNGKDDTDELE